MGRLVQSQGRRAICFLGGVGVVGVGVCDSCYSTSRFGKSFRAFFFARYLRGVPDSNMDLLLL